MLIEHVRPKDAGEHSCTILDYRDRVWNSNPVTLKVIQRLKFKQRPKDKIVTGKSNVVLQCEMDFDKSLYASIEWRLHEEFGKKGGKNIKGPVFHNKGLNHTTFADPLSLDKPKTGHYECIIKTHNITDTVQTKTSAASIIVVQKICEAAPCRNGGSCQSEDSSNTYICICLSGFYGRDCQFFDTKNYGIEGNTVFDNSNNKEHYLNLKCDFGPLAKDYKVVQLFSEQNRSTYTFAEGCLGGCSGGCSGGCLIQKKLTAPKRNTENAIETDNKSVIKCSASVGDVRVTDRRMITFYEFASYDSIGSYAGASNANSNWTINDIGVSSERSLKHHWKERPGRVYQVSSKGENGSRSWSVIVCGYVQGQMHLLCITVATTLFLIVVFPVLLSSADRLPLCCILTAKPSTHQPVVSSPGKWHHYGERLRSLLPANFFKRAKRMLTFISNLNPGELLAAIALYYRGDEYWACCLMTILVSCWSLNVGSFAYFLSSAKNKKLYAELKAIGWKKLAALAFFNQSLATFENDLEDDPLANFEDPRRKRRKIQHRNVFTTYSHLQSFLVLSLTGFILSELMGSEHICLPKSYVFRSPDSKIDNSDFQKLSLRSIIPEKQLSLTANAVKFSNLNETSILKWLFGCKSQNSCTCKKWRTTIDHCLLPSQYPEAFMQEHVECYIYDCFQAPCNIELVVPILLLFKTVFEISLGIVQKTDCEVFNPLTKAFRFVFIVWTIFSSLYLCFYLSDLLQGITQMPSYKLMLFSIPVIMFKIVLPSNGMPFFASKLRKKLIFCAWFFLGYLFEAVIQFILILTLYSYRGCDRNPRNRITFSLLPENNRDLYAVKTRHYWDEQLEKQYSEDYAVHLVDSVTEKGSFLQVRYDFNYVSFAFKYIGTLSILDCLFGFVNLFALFIDYRYLMQMHEKMESRRSRITSESLNGKKARSQVDIEMAERVSEQLGEQLEDKMSEQESVETSKQMSDQTDEQWRDQTSELMNDNTREQISDSMNEQVIVNTSEQLSDQMSDKMTDKTQSK